MKPVCVFLLLCVALVSCKKKDVIVEPAPLPTYRSFGGTTGLSDNSTVESFDNNLLIGGYYGSNISALKIARNGKLVWRNDVNAGYKSLVFSIAETADHSIFLCGSTSRHLASTQEDILLVKLNQAGDTIWTRTYGGSELEYGYNMIATSDGNLLIAASTKSFGDPYGDLYLLKLNTNGDTLWTKTYPDQGEEQPYHLLETRNGEYLLTATNKDNATQAELYMLKINASGTQLWDKRLGSLQNKKGYSTIELPNGDLITCGSINTSSGVEQDVLVMKTDPSGTVIWEKQFGEEHLSETGCSIKLNTDGTYTIAGSSVNTPTGSSSVLVLKVDAAGKQVFLKTFGRVSNNAGINLVNSNNDDNIVIGTYTSGIFITRFNRNGDFK
jgi:hypothetical protein